MQPRSLQVPGGEHDDVVSAILLWFRTMRMEDKMDPKPGESIEAVEFALILVLVAVVVIVVIAILGENAMTIVRGFATWLQDLIGGTR